MRSSRFVAVLRSCMASSFVIALGLMSGCKVAEAPELVAINAALHTWDGQQVPRQFRAFRPIRDVEQIVTCILDETGLRSDNFRLAAGAVPNAAAATLPPGCGNASVPCERMLAYNPLFLKDTDDLVGSKWGGIAVLAHEIGHHLEAHTIGPGGSNPEEELEADEFAGWVLARLGASSEEAQALFRTFDAEETDTHPSSSDRVLAVVNGHQRAGGASPTSCYAHSITVAEVPGDPDQKGSLDAVGKLNFGDDSGPYARDGECDDVRFQGPGRSVYAGRHHVLRDGSDCRDLFERGLVRLRADDTGRSSSVVTDFGDDSGRFARDGECDDVRFGGPGRSVYIGLDHIMRDASDCRSLLDGGLLHVVGDDAAAEAVTAPIPFGDDSGRFARDGECDDVRFDGPGRSVYTGIDHVMRDASDCRSLLERSLLHARTDSPQSLDMAGIDFGNDSGRYANDGECDDARFLSLARELGEHGFVRRDASDCREALAEGRTHYLGDL